MSSLHRLMDIQVGLHADAADFLTVPGTFRRIRLVGGGEGFLPPPNTPISRNDVAALNGQGFTHQRGPIDLASKSPVTKFRGVHDNDGAAVAAADWAAKMEQADLLTSLFGSLPIATASAAPTVATSGHTTTTVVFVGTAPVAGQMFLFQTSSGPRIRQVVSVASLTATVDRAYSGTPTTGSTIIRAARWLWDPSVRNHIHTGWRTEDSEQQSDFLGCAPESLALDIPPGGQLRATWGISPTDVTRAGAKLSPTVTYPTSGDPIMGINATFHLGSLAFNVHGVSLNVTTGNAPRATNNGPNGVLGGVGEEKRGGFVLGFSLRVGASAARGELSRNTGAETLRTALGVADGAQAISAERDGLLTVGLAAGGAMAIRIPTGDLQASLAADGGHTVAACTLTATDTASLGVF